MANETIRFTLEEHTDTPVAELHGPGWFYFFDDAEPIHLGPYPTQEAARAAAEKDIEEAVAASLAQALFGEAA